MKSVKLIHVIGALVAGGAERFVVSLVKKLRADGIDVGLLVLGTRCDAAGLAMIAELRSSGIPYEIGPSLKINWLTLRWYAKQMSIQRPDAIHLHTPNTELVHYLAGFIQAGRISNRCGLFRTLHNTEQSESWIVRRAYSSNRAMCSIACGKAVATQYDGKIGGQLTCIENGVDFSRPINTPGLAISARNELGLASDAYHFVNVGRMSGTSLDESQKSHNALLLAWQQSKLSERKCFLHLLGDGNLRNQLVGLADGDQSIKFHGVRENVHTWLQAANCFVMPSRYEGLPIAAIEAIGAGLPCIFTDIPPLRELLPPAAQWCAVNDVTSLAEKLILAVNESVIPSLAKVESFRERNSLTRTAQQYLNVYRENAYSV